MLPPVLLIICVLCQASHCGLRMGPDCKEVIPTYWVCGSPGSDSETSTHGPPQVPDRPPSLPTDAESPQQPDDSPGPAEAPDDVTDELTRLFESSFLPAPTRSPETLENEHLAELTSVLRQVQSGLLTMAERLDAMQVSQTAVEQGQRALTNRVDVMQRSLEDLAGDLEAMQQTQQTVVGRIDSMKSVVDGVSERVDSVKHTVDGVVDHVQGSSAALSTLSAGVGALVESRGVMAARLHTLLDSRTADAARLDSLSASQAVHSAQLAEARRSLSGVSGRLDALLRLPLTVSGGGVYGGPLPVGGVPWQALGTPCWADDECSGLVDHSVCGEKRRCVCDSGFRRVSSKLCRKIPRLGESCAEDADCHVLTTDSRCSNAGQCVCRGGFSRKDDSGCWPSLPTGSACSDRRQCADGLDCVDDLCSCPVSTHDSYEYRVGGGADCARGRVELRKVGASRWRFACHDYWEDVDATVFCRSVGFSSYGEAVSGLKFDGPVFYAMDDVDCRGDEKHLAHCSYDRLHDCSASSIAGVICHD